MKRFYSPFWKACLVVVLLNSCTETKQENATEQKDTTAAVVDKSKSNASALAHFGTRLQEIVQSDQGILRGIKFGDDVETVKEVESATLKEDSTDHLGYTVELGNYEDLDVRYHLNKSQKVWGFTLDIYLDKQASVDSLYNDFRSYYTERFGPHNFDNNRNMIAWNLADTLKVVVKDVGIPQAPGLQVQMLNLKQAKE